MSTAAAPVIQGRISRVPVSDAGRWQEHLEGVPHDFYHSAAYHRFCEETGAGQAFLAVYREGNRQLLWPYLLRPIPGFAGDRLRDVTSVGGTPFIYGYIWRSVLEPNIYRELNAIRFRGARVAGHTCTEGFFPLYRSPYVPATAAVARS